MNLATIIALIIVAGAVVLASIYLYKHGTCGSCPDAPTCSGHCHRDFLKKLESDTAYQEKSDKIDEILKDHNFPSK